MHLHGDHDCCQQCSYHLTKSAATEPLLQWLSSKGMDAATIDNTLSMLQIRVCGCNQDCRA